MLAALVLLGGGVHALPGVPKATLPTWLELRNHQHFDALSEAIGENALLISGFFTDGDATAVQLFKEAHDTQGAIFSTAHMAHRPWTFTRSYNRVLSAELCEEAADSSVAAEDFDSCLLLQKSSPDGSGGWMAATMNVKDLDDVRSFLVQHAAHAVADYNHSEEL